MINVRKKQILFITCFLLIVSGCGTKNMSKDVQTNNTSASEVTTKTTMVDESKKRLNIRALIPSEDMIAEGKYKVGDDIPAGEYFLIADGFASFHILSDINGELINFDFFSSHSIISVLEGQYLELSRCAAVMFDKVPKNIFEGKTISDGMYKIGYHIPAGEYKLTADRDIEGEGCYCLYTDSLCKDIISIEFFEDSKYINVFDGQYLKLSRCTLSLN